MCTDVNDLCFGAGANSADSAESSIAHPVWAMEGLRLSTPALPKEWESHCGEWGGNNRPVADVSIGALLFPLQASRHRSLRRVGGGSNL